MDIFVDIVLLLLYKNNTLLIYNLQFVISPTFSQKLNAY